MALRDGLHRVRGLLVDSKEPHRGSMPGLVPAMPRGPTPVGDSEDALGDRERPALDPGRGFLGDASHVQTRPEPRNPCLLQHMVLNLLQQDTTVKSGVAILNCKADCNLDYTETVLAFTWQAAEKHRVPRCRCPKTENDAVRGQTNPSRSSNPSVTVQSSSWAKDPPSKPFINP